MFPFLHIAENNAIQSSQPSDSRAQLSPANKPQITHCMEASDVDFEPNDIRIITTHQTAKKIDIQEHRDEYLKWTQEDLQYESCIFTKKPTLNFFPMSEKKIYSLNCQKYYFN